MKKWLTYINGNTRKEYMQDYYRKNRERINNRVSEYCKNHDEERRIRRKEWYESHRELQIRRVRASQRARKFKRWNTWRIDKKIDACPTERSKQKLLRKRERVREIQKEVAKKRWDLRMKERKDLREAKIQAKIDARKEEIAQKETKE